MEELSLKVEHVTKEYRLGTIGGGTLKGEIQSKFALMRGKEDPNAKIDAVHHNKNEKFIALNDVSLEIKKGEKIGIIGHNGAGKSTLLKLICRVTAPTKGNIYINGRITSMLEVGTGFHGELTGKENIYLNGSILGMSKKEIDEKYDEIVDFSEIGKFIDTPVKRYSSGMNIKLGFSIASHLNSEIMIMDEVLAVGDVAFQNKCIKQMKKVANEEGRTILYVSHNMATVRALCDRCIVLDHGTVSYIGEVERAIQIYSKLEDDEYDWKVDLSSVKRNSSCNLQHKVIGMEIIEKKTKFGYGDNIHFRLKWISSCVDKRLMFKAVIDASYSAVGVAYVGVLNTKMGENEGYFTIDTSYLFPGSYSIYLKFYDEDQFGNTVMYDQCVPLRFIVNHSEKSIHLKNWYNDWGYAVLPCIRYDG